MDVGFRTLRNAAQRRRVQLHQRHGHRVTPAGLDRRSDGARPEGDPQGKAQKGQERAHGESVPEKRRPGRRKSNMRAFVPALVRALVPALVRNPAVSTRVRNILVA